MQWVWVKEEVKVDPAGEKTEACAIPKASEHEAVARVKGWS